MGVILKDKYVLAYKVFGDTPNKPKVDSLKIDKLAITLDIPTKERANLDKKLEKMVTEQHQSAQPIPGGKYKNGYRLFAIDDYLIGAPDRATIKVHTDPFNKTHNYMRIEFNPSKVPSFFAKELTNILLKDGYSRLMNSGRVTKWDEAVDIHFCELKDLYLYYPKMPYSMIIYKSGFIESMYLGKTPGPKYFCIYNKTKQIKATNANFFYDPLNALFNKEPEPTYPILRIELRQNLKMMSASMGEGVKGLPNDISKLRIYNRVVPENQTALKTDTDKMIFKQFLCNCNHEGLNQARLLLTPDWRKKIDSIMAKHKVAWWKPDNVQAQREAAINSIMCPPKLPKQHAAFFTGLKSVCN